MLAGVGLAFLLPKQIYLFLISSGGFALLFTYVIIMATHYKYRKVYGCPPKGHCQLRGYPHTTILGLLSLITIIVSMPLVPGQGSGLLAGLLLVLMYGLAYVVFKAGFAPKLRFLKIVAPAANMEVSEEITPKKKHITNTDSETDKP